MHLITYTTRHRPTKTKRLRIAFEILVYHLIFDKASATGIILDICGKLPSMISGDNDDVVVLVLVLFTEKRLFGVHRDDELPCFNHMKKVFYDMCLACSLRIRVLSG